MKITDIITQPEIDIDLDDLIDIENDNDDNILYVGVVGMDSNLLDETMLYEVMDNLLDEVYEEFVEEGDFEDLVVVSESLDSGIHKISFKIAEELGYKTIGFVIHSEEESDEMDQNVYQTDEIIYLGQEEFPEEFVDNVDLVIRVGDSENTSRIMDLAEDDPDLPVIEYDT